jgi:hypothetical protein
MKMTKRQLVKIFLVLVVLLAAISTYFAQGDGQRSNKSAPVAQPSREAARQLMIEDQLKTLLAPSGVGVGDGGIGVIGPALRSASYTETLIHWAVKPSSPAGPTGSQGTAESHALSILERASREGSLPRPRSLELSEEQVLVVAIGADNQLRWWTLIPDPRLMRAEFPGPNGELTGQTVMRTEADFSVAYPADPSITELRFYHPRLTDGGFVLETIGTAAAR